ncbi:hypothetical protein [Uliginosibacterium sediminicola]|uniref:Phage tail assembly chaperone n=1 Tax=Uliginosibacterium sediminicola TaxID=2024550 RepID=A0ABU9Z3F3_9RHOO
MEQQPNNEAPQGAVQLDCKVMPLRCEVRGMSWIDMQVSIGTLRFAAENHPDFWDGVSGASVPNIKVTDAQEFAKAVAQVINDEAEDGSTLLTRMLDKAIAKAVESGCEGVDHGA